MWWVTSSMAERPFPLTLFPMICAAARWPIWGAFRGRAFQVYDTLGYKNGFFLSSYVAACIDYYDVTTQKRRHIAQLSKDYGQERIYQMEVGPDGMIYAGTVPS